MEIKTFRKGEVIFRAGDPGECMYDVYAGRIGVYSGYGTPEQKLLMEYYPDQYLGEMGLLDHAPRSATAVAMENNSSVAVVTEADFKDYFQRNPARVLMVMRQLSQNLRRRTDDYMAVCREIHDLSEKEAVK